VESGRPLGWSVPELDIERDDRAATLPPDRFVSTAQVWRDHDGTVAAYGYTDDGIHTMNFPNLGAFHFSARRGDSVSAELLSTVDADAALDSYRRMVVPMVLQARGLEALHASAILVDGSVVAFCGTSQSGKSTIAYALAHGGAVLWADDAVAFELTPEGAVALPLPSRIRLRPRSEGFFREAGWVAGLEAAKETRTRSPDPAPMRALFMLERSSSTEAETRPLSPAEAFPLALTHAFCFSLEDSTRKRSMVQTYLELVRRLPVTEMTLPEGLAHLERTLGLVEATIQRM